MANQWFKFYAAEYLSDIKILQMPCEERSCWITILCLANQGNGVIKFLSEEQLLGMSGVKREYSGVLEKFEDMDMITQSNGIVTVKNWEKRQYSEGYSRVQAFRKRKSNANDNDRIEKIRKDKKRIEEIILPDWINKNAWNAWVKYRKEISKTLKPSTVRFQLKFLENHKEDHAQIIKNSITNGWTGLFALKTGEQRKPAVFIEKNNSREVNERRNLLSKQASALVNKMKVGYE